MTGMFLSTVEWSLRTEYVYLERALCTKIYIRFFGLDQLKSFFNNLIIIYIIYVGSWMEIIFSVGRLNGVL